jgi:hypothetical protein
MQTLINTAKNLNNFLTTALKTPYGGFIFSGLLGLGAGLATQSLTNNPYVALVSGFTTTALPLAYALSGEYGRSAGLQALGGGALVGIGSAAALKVTEIATKYFAEHSLKDLVSTVANTVSHAVGIA